MMSSSSQSGALVSCGRARGFTLVELMVVMVIVGVILMVALPGFRNVTLATRLSNYANELVASVYLARGEAIKRNDNVRLCASADGENCATSGGWAQGWVVLDPNDVVLKEQTGLESGFSMNESGGVHTLTFDSTGFAGTATTFKVCRQVPSVGHQEREILINTVGRTSVKRTNNGVCP